MTPFELFTGDMGDPRERHAIRGMKSYFHRTMGLLCFSRSWTNSALWSRYASKHRGMCLGFDLNDEYVGEVEYADSRFLMDYADANPAKGIDPEYLKRLALTKFRHWEYEDEVRVAVGLDEGTMKNGSYFLAFTIDVALKEVILGPLCELQIDVVRHMVDSIYEAQGVVVRKARLGFTKFAVVPDQR